MLPSEWSEDVIISLFEKSPLCQCLAYPISAANGSKGNVLENFQDYEYRVAMFLKVAQGSMGTAFFPSGAVSTWRAPALLEILSRHDTMFRGDDLQMGLILHTLYNSKSFLHSQELYQGNFQIKLAPYWIATTVPVHWFHLKDLFSRSYWKRLPKCDCGEPSLFYQRARSWEVARHRFFFKLAAVLFSRQ
ncbi:hypothetical protein HK096_001831, partial [Nowakowskiella sp. JEL0078]